MKKYLLILFILLSTTFDNNLYSNIPYQLNSAVDLIEEGNFKKALKIVNEYLSDNAEDAYGIYLRGIIKESMNDFKGALDDYRYAIFLNENMIDVFKKNIQDIYANNLSNENVDNFISNDNDDFYLGSLTKGSNIQEKAISKSKVLGKLPKNSYLFVSGVLKDNGFYYVYDISTGKEGWISAKNINLIKKIEATQESLIDEATQIYSSNTELSINNSTNQTLTLKIAENGTYKFKPYEQRTITLKPGRYKLFASVPNASPHLGWEDLNAGYNHSIKYYIKTEYRKK